MHACIYIPTVDLNSLPLSLTRIFVANLNGTQKRTLISNVKADGIAVDWLSRNLFWVNPRDRMIEVATIEGKFRRPVINTGLVEPRALAVHPRLRYVSMYEHIICMYVHVMVVLSDL